MTDLSSKHPRRTCKWIASQHIRANAAGLAQLDSQNQAIKGPVSTQGAGCDERDRPRVKRDVAQHGGLPSRGSTRMRNETVRQVMICNRLLKVISVLGQSTPPQMSLRAARGIKQLSDERRLGAHLFTSYETTQ